MKAYRIPIGIVAAAAAALIGALLTCGADPVVHWLMRPWSGDLHHHLAMPIAWHARLMVAGWVVAMPIGILVARFFKVLPSQNWPKELDNKTWWNWHRLLQALGYVLALGAIWLVWDLPRPTGLLMLLHVAAGWTVVTLGGLQILSGLLRGSKGAPADVATGRAAERGDHYDMTRRRIVFEHVHKAGGYVAVLLSWATAVMGLILVDAPRWMWLVIGLWWIVAALCFAIWQRLGLCIDTYQAIWGADPVHPGNTVRPIGFGVRRREFRPEQASNGRTANAQHQPHG
ncbi:cytochrome b561 domain-containing protein [Phenylobacterium montanum]|uniref:Cytochrome b561 domain-containing protein n=1 Tax=Phenylobacterium montanum TaxID=2823693 RepID=A0A975G455_9CAUL|nr:cytochrome b561 domain-containing protein [Caulobacter sp. S6]QUD90233.1 hypothetical protein KCG34_10400 [Caulobacter sp. S6]